MKKKRLLGILLSFVMMLGFMPGMNLTAYAVSTQYDPDIEAGAGEKKTETLNEVKNTGADEGGAKVYARDGGTANLAVTGDVESTRHSIVADSKEGGKTTVEVGKNVTSSEESGVIATSATSASYDGKTATNVEVSGNVKAKQVGVQAQSQGSGNTTVNVSGDVTAENYNGIFAESYGKGTTTVNVDGDVTSYYGEYIVASNGTTTVKVGGDVTAKDENTYGMHINTSGGGKATVTAEDVTANGDGMVFFTYDEGSLVEAEVKNVTSTGANGLVVIPYGGKTDILVDGTVKGNVNGIFVQNDINVEKMGDIDITVWQIEKGKDGDFIKYQGQASDIEEVKKHVHYIVKLEPSDGADLSATKADGSLLDQYHDLDTALSGDKVLLKVNLLPGYQLDGAYNGDGEKVALQKDANGNYYVVVGDEGGIYLSVATSKTKHNISYNLDGGSYNGQIGTITEVYDYGTAIKLLGTPTREGYRFLYWRGSQYDAGADYTVEGDHLFTAVWEKIVPKDTDDTDDTQDSYTPKTAAKASPATGDESNLAVWVTILMIAVLALIDEFVRRREYNK